MYQTSTGKNLDITEEEMKAIERAMKEKEFRDLFQEYVKEISDPKNREEYDQYLRQIEREKELPKGMKLVQPVPGFVMKTIMKSKKNPATSQKCFINICSAEEIDKPYGEPSPNNPKQGLHWKIPYSCGKPRLDQDSKKEVCSTIDCVFNPEAIKLANKHEQFMKVICETAIDAAQKQLNEPFDTISKDYKVLRKRKCKGEKPSLITMRMTEQEAKKQEKNDNKTSNITNNKPVERNEDYAPKLYQEFMKQQMEYQKSQNVAEAEKNQKIKELSSTTFEKEINQCTKIKGEGAIKPKHIEAPKYKIIHGTDVDIGQFVEDNKPRLYQRPKFLKIKIELPRVSSNKEINLDINQENLVLDIKDKYYLDIKLPFKAKEEEGSAKFDAKTKTLTVTVPTLIIKNEIEVGKSIITNQKMNEQNGNSEVIESIIQKKQNDDIVEQKEDGNNEKLQNNQPENTKEITNDSDSLLEFKDHGLNLKFVDHESIQKQKVSKPNPFDELESDLIGTSKNPLIEVLDTKNSTTTQAESTARDENDIDPESETKSKSIIYTPIEFKSQETYKNYFFIFHLPSYNKDYIKCLFAPNQILLSYYDQIKYDKTTILTFWAELNKEYLLKETKLNFVKDYVVLDIAKKEEGFWEKSAYTMKEWNEQKAQELFTQNSIDEIKTKLDKINSNEIEKQDQEGSRSDIESKNAPGKDEELSNSKNEQVDVKLPDQKQMDKKQLTLNFINFDKDNFIFELD